MTDNSLANGDTGSSETIQAKTYTQEEVNDMMARTKGAVQKKFEKQLAELGDIEELKSLKTEAEKRKTEEQLKRGEFEKTLQELASKKDAEIARRDQIIREYTVDVPLVSAAAQFRSVNPEQVKALLKPSVRLNDSGEVEVLDDKGKVRYNDAGQPFKVADLVQDFLANNPHFVQPTPATTQGKSNIGQSREKLDLSKLDMKNPENRRIYKEAMTQTKR